MKVLFLSQGREISDQISFHAAFEKFRQEGVLSNFLNVPFLGYAEKFGWEAFYQEVLRINSEFQPDLVFFQFYHSGGDGGIASCCRQLKAAENHPLIFGSSGDLFYTGIGKRLARPVPVSILELAAHSDAFFSTSMGNVADELVQHGARNLIFLPHAFCPENFPYWATLDGCEKRYDVVMVGSKGRILSRRIVSSVSNNLKRYLVVKNLFRHFGNEFSVFGKGWNLSCAKGLLPYEEQFRCFAESRVVVDAPAPTMKTDYYASDRPFFILASGTPLVQFYTPRFDRIFRPDDHAYYVHRLRDVCSVCDRVRLLPEDVIQDRRQRVVRLVKERHLISHRIDTIISAVEAIKGRRNGAFSKQEAMRHLRLWHFLPEVDLEDECQHAIRNWTA